MRIRILELPSIVTGDDIETPYALILDQAGDDTEALSQVQEIGHTIGARGTIVFSDTVDFE